jgi:cytochrome c biogenesis protein CcdA
MSILQFWKGMREGMATFGQKIATLVNTTLLLIVYLLGTGVTAIIAKIFGKHFLEMKTHKKKTYWEKLDLKKGEIEEYYRQF